MKVIEYSIVIFLLFFSGTILAQNNKRIDYEKYNKKLLKGRRKENRKLSADGLNLFHLSGVGALNIRYLKGQKTSGGELAYDYSLSSRFFSRTSLSYEAGTVFNEAYQGYYIHHGVGAVAFHLKNRYYLSGLAGGTAVYDAYPALEMLRNTWNVGLHYGLEAEIGVWPSLALVVNKRQLIMKDSPNRWLAAVGVKWRLH